MQHHKSFGPSARELALNHWPEILKAAGVKEEALQDVHSVCPLCGSAGKAWFRFDDKEGRGTYFCNQCGAGDGMQFLMNHLGTSNFVEAARFVEGYFQGVSVPVPAPVHDIKVIEAKKETERIAKTLQRAWNQAVNATLEGAAGLYLCATRQLPISALPPCIRLHPGMAYFEKVVGAEGVVKNVQRGTHPVMLCKVTDATGRPVGLHRTYLTPQGAKAPYAKVKKLMMSLGMKGASIRLFPVTGTSMGVAEGVETAYAAHFLTGLPVWATVSSTIMENFEPPAGVTMVTIFADNDLPDARGKRAGQDAAQKLKERLEAHGIQARIVIPAKAGTDFHDVWLARMAQKQVRHQAPATAQAQHA